MSAENNYKGLSSDGFSSPLLFPVVVDNPMVPKLFILGASFARNIVTISSFR